jgi:ribosomal protein RSM22 (predicted rRNA methylase)
VVRVEAGTPTGFRRVPRGRGVQLQLADDPTRYLRHRNGVVVTGDASVFLLS